MVKVADVMWFSACRFPGRPNTRPPGETTGRWDVHRYGSFACLQTVVGLEDVRYRNIGKPTGFLKAVYPGEAARRAAHDAKGAGAAVPRWYCRKRVRCPGTPQSAAGSCRAIEYFSTAALATKAEPDVPRFFAQRLEWHHSLPSKSPSRALRESAPQRRSRLSVNPASIDGSR